MLIRACSSNQVTKPDSPSLFDIPDLDNFHLQVETIYDEDNLTNSLATADDNLICTIFPDVKGNSLEFLDDVKVEEEVDDLFFDCEQGDWDPEVGAGSA